MTISLKHHLGGNWTIQCVTDESHLEQDMATMKKLVDELNVSGITKEISQQIYARNLASLEQISKESTAEEAALKARYEEIDAKKDERV
jgi:hypothetical protein